jgi:uncharacterized damage-inducible protein DinB
MDTNIRTDQPEPWLRGTLTDVPAVARGVLHALELASEDLHRWCGNLSDAQLTARPAGVPPVAFHLHHIARSLDRLLTYAEGHALNSEQLVALQSELAPIATSNELFHELDAAFNHAQPRIRSLSQIDMATPRTVGRNQLPTTVGGLLVHIADHTQRHVGQAITTAKIARNFPST